MSFIPSVGPRLRSLRLEAGLSQAELGRRVGVTQQTVHGVETGEHGLSLATAVRVASALDVTLDQLLAPEEMPT